MTSRIKETTQDEIEYSFVNMLDELYGSFKIGNMQFYASDILKSCDPIAYRCELLDYEDAFFGEED